jgi:hypothetical protein
MPEQPASFAELLQKKILPNVQRIALLISLIGLAFLILHYPGADQLLMIGFSTLAMAYFFMAFMPMHIPVGCKPDLYSTIVYKIIYIGCSVATIGILFQFLIFNGARDLLRIGSGTTGVAMIISVILIARKNDNWIVLKDAIIRGAGLLLLSLYMMRQASII